MNREHYIAGDRGTSGLWLSLCLRESVLETRQGPGIGALRESAADALRPLIAGWRETYGPLPCTSRLGSPEVMRAEETRIAGAIARHPGLGEGQHLLCLAGTPGNFVDGGSRPEAVSQ